MAILKDGYLRGQIGNVVNRKVGSLNVIQTKPSDKLKQTQWTQNAAADFGTASAAGAVIRGAFRSVHRDMHDNEMHNRLVKRMLRVLRGNGKRNQGLLQVKYGNIQRLVDFQFNDNCHIYDHIYFTPLISFAKNGITTVELPALEVQRNFNVPNKCSHLIMKLDVIAIDFSGKRSTSIGNIEIKLARYGENEQHADPQTHVFEVKDKQYDSIVVSMSIIYLAQESRFATLLNTETFNPAGIVAAYNIDS